MENFFPIQTSSMPLKDKLLNMLWKFVNATLFRYTPPIQHSLENIGLR